MKYTHLLFSFFILFKTTAHAQADIEKKLQTQLILAENGATIDITEGVFSMSKSLSMDGKKRHYYSRQGDG